MSNDNIFLSGNKDVDRLIIGKLSDRDVLEICKINQYIYTKVCDENFFRNRVISKYPETVKYKDNPETGKTTTWKNYFFNIVYYIDKLKKYNFDYQKEGSPELEYLARKLVLSDYNVYSKDDSLIVATEKGHLPLVKYLLEHGADIHLGGTIALIRASRYGYLPIVKYLVEKGANVNFNQSIALILASEYGYLEIVKYLVENGADITSHDNASLRWASINRHLPVVKYIKSLQ